MRPSLICVLPSSTKTAWAVALQDFPLALAEWRDDGRLVLPATLPDNPRVLALGFAPAALLALAEAVAAAGLTLEIPLADHQRAQIRSSWYPSLVDLCPEQKLLPLSHRHALPTVLNKLAWPSLHLRSLRAGQASATDAAQLPSDTGIAVVRGTAPASAHRFFVWHQNVWPHPTAPEGAVQVAQQVTRRFWHLFYVVDVAEVSPHRWQVVDVHDAQCADLAEWSAALWLHFLGLSALPTLGAASS